MESARVKEGHRWYELCRETAACLAKHGFSVITGGGPGLMEAADRGAAEAGGLSVGLNIELPMEQQTNPYVNRSLDFESLVLIQTNRIKHFPTILVDSQHWAPPTPRRSLRPRAAGEFEAEGTRRRLWIANVKHFTFYDLSLLGSQVLASNGCYLASIDVAVSKPVAIGDLPERQRARLRDRSKLLFGNRDRLEVLVAIALSADGLVNATDLQGEIGMAQSRVRTQLVALSIAGLLVTFPGSGGKRWYQRSDSALWETSLALYREWTT